MYVLALPNGRSVRMNVNASRQHVGSAGRFDESISEISIHTILFACCIGKWSTRVQRATPSKCILLHIVASHFMAKKQSTWTMKSIIEERCKKKKDCHAQLLLFCVNTFWLLLCFDVKVQIGSYLARLLIWSSRWWLQSRPKNRR